MCCGPSDPSRVSGISAPSCRLSSPVSDLGNRTDLQGPIREVRMRSGLMTALLGVVLAAPAAAEQSAAARIYVHAAGAGAHGAADSVEDVKKLLAAQKPTSLLALANSREEADLVLEVMGRHTEDKMNYDLTPPSQWIYSIL